MNWEYILTQVFWIFLKALMIFGAYSFTKFYVVEELVLKHTKPSLFTKIWIIGGIVGVDFILCGLTTSNGKTRDRFMIYFIVILIPALLGAWSSFDKENKMTAEEKFNLKMKLKQEAKEAAEKTEYGE